MADTRDEFNTQQDPVMRDSDRKENEEFREEAAASFVRFEDMEDGSFEEFEEKRESEGKK